MDYKSHTMKINGKSLTYKNGHILMLIIFKCNGKEYKFLDIKTYDTNGKQVDSREYDLYEEWETAAPQTVIDIVLQKVCERYN